MTAWAAVILAGGSGRRLGGADKPAIVVDGRTLLDRAVEAAEAGAETVVVGPRRDTSSAVTWAREEPAGSGPLAALAAGLAALSARPQVVVVLAADLPLVTSALVGRLVGALDAETDAVAVVDAGGRVQPLLAAYRTEPLTSALQMLGDPRDRPFRDLLPGLRLATVVDAAGASDIDTPGDLARWRQ